MTRALVEKLKFAEHPDNIWWSFDDKEFSIRTTPEQIYYDRSNVVSRPIGTLREECIKTAISIRNNVNGRIAVLYSGGVDSEIIVQSFLEANIPIDVYIIRYQNNINLHDISTAIKFCNDSNISYKFLDIDIEKWLENEVEAYALPIKCQSPQISLFYWAIDQIDDYVILGDGDLALYHLGNSNLCIESYGEKWGISRWLMHTNHPGCPKFYRYSSECEAAYLLDPMVNDFVTIASKEMDISHFKYVKPFVLQKHFGTRYRKKLTGFENIMDACELQRENLQKLLGNSDFYMSSSYDLLVDLKTNMEFDWKNISAIDINELALSSKQKEKMDICDDNSQHMIYNYRIEI